MTVYTEIARGGMAGLEETFARLDRTLQRAVSCLVEAHGVEGTTDPFRGLYISERDARLWAAAPRIPAILGAADGDEALLDLVVSGSPLEALAQRYGLTSFDLDLVAIALAVDLEPAYGRLYAFLQDDVSRRRPSVDLALNLLCPTLDAKLARREHFAADAPLIRHGLIELAADPPAASAPLPARSLVLNGAVVRFLLGGGIDDRLRSAVELIEAGGSANGSEWPVDLLERLKPAADRARRHGDRLLVHLFGASHASAQTLTSTLAAETDAPLLVLDVEAALDFADDFAPVVRTALLEAELRDAVTLVRPVDALRVPECADRRRQLLSALACHRGVVILAGLSSEPFAGPRVAGVVNARLPIPSHAERKARWQSGLSAADISLPDDDLERLASRFRLSEDQIDDAVLVARNGMARGADVNDIFNVARSRSDTALAGVATKIEPVHDWSHIALPDETIVRLREICQQVEERHRVLDEWGFGKRLSLGKGVSALFAGPSGTGKTTAADIIARELALDLYKVDLAGVVSKYIGETEKNLERIFGAAENANAILFFDEADALFGKRSEVRDSHDRYANIEIAYLLQKMEQYEGVAILATNLRQNMDEAFVRRLQFVVEFPFPDEVQRERIWRLLFPEEAEKSGDINFSRLARQFRVSGGSIKNIVLGAAFLAAGEGTPIGTRHLLHATRREYQKSGRVLTEPEVAGFEEIAA